MIRIPALSAVLATVALLAGLPAAAPAAVLIDCDGGHTGGDNIGGQGFYVPSYPGSTVDGLDLWISALVAGDYTVTVEVRADTYDGPILTQDQITLTLAADTRDNQLAAFRFPSVAVPQGSTVAFTHRVDVAPPGGATGVYYAIWGSAQPCGFTQTNGMNPPLSSYRRNGIRGVLYGQTATPVEGASWGRVKSGYR